MDIEDEDTPYIIFNISRQRYDNNRTEIDDYTPGEKKEIIREIIARNEWSADDILCIHNEIETYVCHKGGYFTLSDLCMPEIMEGGVIYMRHNGEQSEIECW